MFIHNLTFTYREVEYRASGLYWPRVVEDEHGPVEPPELEPTRLEVFDAGKWHERDPEDTDFDVICAMNEAAERYAEGTR